MSMEHDQESRVIAAIAAAGGVGGGGGGDASAANQTTQTARLDSILAKIIAAPATEATLASILTNTAKGTAAGATGVNSTALEASRVIKASAGTLITLAGISTRTSAQYIQIHNSTTVPADTAVPQRVIYVPPGPINFSIDIPITGAPYTTGISVCNSSTLATKTIGAADCWFNAVII